MEAPCYCTNHDSELPFPASNPIGLNTALQELQQLKFEPELGLRKPVIANFGKRKIRMRQHPGLRETIVDNQTCHRYRKMRKRLRDIYEPYFYSGRTKNNDADLPNSPSCSTVTASSTTERASSPVVTRQDSGNKSNPSSPVKSQKSLSSSEVTLVRSRSLDDLDISKLNLEDLETKSCCYSRRLDIDNVSQRISKLQVN